VAPMFHDAGWALPWACAAVGAKMVFSQADDPAVLCDLIAAETVTHVGGGPAFWTAMAGQALPEFELALSGGAALPPGVVERLMRAGLRVVQVRGTSGTVTCEPPEWDTMTFAQQVACKSGQGWPLYGREVRVVSRSDPSCELARDGITEGALQARGPWTVARHFAAEEDATDADGWFDTGEIAAIGPDGAVHLAPETLKP
jgi:acyl-CoA synthetase (AMP-forming)/AMP-acid ligase II